MVLSLRCVLSGLILVCFILTVSGCTKEKKLSEFDRPVVRKSLPAKEAPPATYSKYYSLWWISHSHLDDAIKRVRETGSVDRMFMETVDSLQRFKKFLDEDRKEQVEGFVDEYERLRDMTKPANPGRRVTRGLNRLKDNIRRELSPKNVGLGEPAEPEDRDETE